MVGTWDRKEQEDDSGVLSSQWWPRLSLDEIVDMDSDEETSGLTADKKDLMSVTAFELVYLSNAN